MTALATRLPSRFLPVLATVVLFAITFGVGSGLYDGFASGQGAGGSRSFSATINNRRRQRPTIQLFTTSRIPSSTASGFGAPRPDTLNEWSPPGTSCSVAC